MRRKNLQITGWALLTVSLCGFFVMCSGCTTESTRVALATFQRVEEVDTAIFERQAAGLRAYMFRDTVARLGLTDEQAAVLNAAWNDRDLMEFWAVQHARQQELSRTGVLQKLVSTQSMLDLLWKDLETRLERAFPAKTAAEAALPAKESD